MKRMQVIVAVLIVLGLGAGFLPKDATAAVQNPWISVAQPSMAGVGAIRAVAAVSGGKIAFAMVSSPVSSGIGTSYLMRTTDGGKYWFPSGNFDERSNGAPVGLSRDRTLASPTKFLLAASPRFSQDYTIFVVVIYPWQGSFANTASSQIFKSTDGGQTFKVLGGVYFPNDEVIKAIAISPNYTDGADYSLAVGTINPTDRKAGNLYVWKAGGLQRQIFGDSFSPQNLDIFALVFPVGDPNQLIVVATPDSTTDQNVYEYRITFSSATNPILLPDTAPRRVQVPGVTKSSDGLSQNISLVLPTDWRGDANIIAVSLGSYSGTNIFKRIGSGYKVVFNSNNLAVSNMAMIGGNRNGAVLAGGSQGGQAALVRSIDGGETWVSVLSGPKGGIDGLDDAKISVAAGTIYVGTGLNRGGVFKSSDNGQSWQDSSLYSDAHSAFVDWALVKDGVVVLMTSSSGDGAIFKMANDLSWSREWRLAGSGYNLSNSRLFATSDSNVFAVQGAWGDSFNSSQLIKSTDAGNTWVQITDPSDTFSVSNIWGNGEKVFAQLANSTIMYSNDGGGSWKQSWFSTSGKVVSVAVSDNGGIVFAMADNPPMVFVSRDGGQTSWQAFGNVIPGSSAGGLALSSDDTLFATTKGNNGGVYYLKNVPSVTADTNWFQRVPASSVIGADSSRFGMPAVTGKALYVPAGNVGVSISDIDSGQWKTFPFASPVLSGSAKIGVREVAGVVRVFAQGVYRNICFMDDLSIIPVATPAPAATPTATPVVTPTQTPVSTPIAVSLSGISSKLFRVYYYDPVDKGWAYFDPMLPGTSTLFRLQRGKAYWFSMIESVSFQRGGFTYDLRQGWNLVGWMGD